MVLQSADPGDFKMDYVDIVVYCNFFNGCEYNRKIIFSQTKNNQKMIIKITYIEAYQPLFEYLLNIKKNLKAPMNII